MAKKTSKKSDDDDKRDGPELGSASRARKSTRQTIREIKADLPRPNAAGVGVKGARALVYNQRQMAARLKLAQNLAENEQLLEILADVAVRPVSDLKVGR